MKPQPGDIGFAVIQGGVGVFVALGQLILADACRYTHAYVVTGEDEVVEAMPSGARRAPLAGRDVPGQFRYARLPFKKTPPTGTLIMDCVGISVPWGAVDQGASFVDAARRYLGTRYGFSTYLYLAFVQWGAPSRWLKRYVSNNRRMICSQLVDQALADAGAHLFDDGRIPQDVTPGDLFYRLQELGATFFDWRPGDE